MMNGSVCFALQAHCSLLDCTQESTPVSTFVTRNKVAVVIRFVFVQYLLLGLISLFKDYLYDIISLILHCMRRFANKYNQNLYLNSLLSNLCVQFIINFWFLTELEFLIRRKQQNSCEGISSEYNIWQLARGKFRYLLGLVIEVCFWPWKVRMICWSVSE